MCQRVEHGADADRATERPAGGDGTATSLIVVRTTRIECPRPAQAVISPSRGPVPGRQPMQAPVATPFNSDSADQQRDAGRDRVRQLRERERRSIRPRPRTLQSVPIPGAGGAAIQTSRTTTPAMIAQVPTAARSA